MIILAALLAAADPGLVPLLERFRLSVPDAREASDLQVCPPRKIDRDGWPVLTDVALSRPRAPRQYFVAKWKAGRVVQLIPYGVDSSAGEASGFETIALRATERRFEPCRWISPAELDAAWAEVDAR